jgi:hypothetical protein
MSIHSKIKRQAGKRGKGKRPDKPREAAIEPHAELRDQQGALLAGIVRRDGEWVLGMGGKIAGSSASAAHVLAMVRRAARLHQLQDRPVRLIVSDALKDAAQAEAAAQGLTFDQFEARLREEMESGDSRAEKTSE